MIVFRRNVPNVFAYVPPFTIFCSNKERALYFSNFLFETQQNTNFASLIREAILWISRKPQTPGNSPKGVPYSTLSTDIVARSIFNPYFVNCRALFTIKNTFFCVAQTIKIRPDTPDCLTSPLLIGTLFLPWNQVNLILRKSGQTFIWALLFQIRVILKIRTTLKNNEIINYGQIKN